ncbi:MAG: hypothetical protein ABR928_16605 [Terracidiphilus sp.]|jgi:hypothetical protein
MIRSLLILSVSLAAVSAIGLAQATVRVEPASLQGPRALPEQTGTAAIRDYLESWQSFSAAFEQNRTDLLGPAFVGSARDKLAQTIQQQAALGIRTRYQDRSHDIQIVFYSPDGLSIELTDKVGYDVEILDHDKVKTIQHLNARYVIVVTPAEVRWRVRVFQADRQ